MYVIPNTFHNNVAYISSFGVIYNLAKIYMYRVGTICSQFADGKNDIQSIRVTCLRLPNEDGTRSRIEICMLNRILGSDTCEYYPNPNVRDHFPLPSQNQSNGL